MKVVSGLDLQITRFLGFGLFLKDSVWQVKLNLFLIWSLTVMFNHSYFSVYKPGRGKLLGLLFVIIIPWAVLREIYENNLKVVIKI